MLKNMGDANLSKMTDIKEVKEYKDKADALSDFFSAQKDFENSQKAKEISMRSARRAEETLGEEATKNLIKVLVKRGWTILRADKAGEGGVAFLFESDDKYPVMDIIAMRDAEIVFFDSKGKSHSSYWRNGEQETHGIDGWCWDNYDRQAIKSGRRAIIAIYEKGREMEPFGKENGKIVPSNTLLLYDLYDFDRREDADVASYGKGGMVYWRREDCLEEIDLD